MTTRALALFVARRLAALAVLLAIISFGVFSLLYLAPGDTVQGLLGARQATPDLIAQLRAQYHLDDPFLTQYWIWLSGALHGDLGLSSFSGVSVIETIRARFPVTAFLGVYAFTITMIVGVSLGVAAALRKRSTVDRSIVGLSVVGVSMPAFVTGTLLLYLLAVRFEIFPAFGAGSGFTDRLYHLTLPAIALAFTQATFVLKLTRAAMIEALDQDYVAFARARGVPAARVVFAYALRNALVPVVTAGGIVLGALLTGAVLIEVVFALPGLGSLLIDSVNAKDIPMVQGLAILAATTIVLVNLLTDLLYLYVDPRIRLGAAPA
jgi:peptide/nickel transport system permease protein